MDDKKQAEFESELVALLNKYSCENGSDTPDYILAEYLRQCLTVFNDAVLSREDWYGRLKEDNGQ